MQTIVEEFTGVSLIPDEYMLQVQTALLVCERKWCDFISYSGGLPMAVFRVEANTEIQEAIIAAAGGFEERILTIIADYHAAIEARKYPPTERRVEEEMVI